MDSDALTPDSRQALLSGLREQLGNIDSTQRAVKDQMTQLQVGGFEAAVAKLRLVSLKMVESQTALREVLDSIARAMLRHLKIDDLPDELLVGVFSHLSNLADIKHLRLSSWRLNKISSHLLLETIHINMSPSSLVRLDRASRHRDISPGIHRIVASVDLYHRYLAKDFKAFAECSIDELAELDSWEHPPSRQAHSRISRSWKRFLTNPESLPSDDKLEARLTNSDIHALHNGYLRYYQLYLEQRGVLCDGSFGQAIAAAISRMPNFKQLVIRDRSPITEDNLKELRSSRTQKELENLVKDPTLLVETMMLRTCRWEGAETSEGDPPYLDLLYQIPLAIHAEGSTLAHLKTDLTPPQVFYLVLGQDQYPRLQSFAQGLKSFRFRIEPYEKYSWAVPRRREREETARLYRFLYILTRSKHLNELALDLADLERDLLEDNRTHDPNRITIGPLLVSLPSTKLENIHLKNCSLHLKELEALVDRLSHGQVVLGLCYVYLLSGTWADAVEMLRTEVLSGRLRRESVSNFLATSSQSTFPVERLLDAAA
ncbi:hypothetical protein Daus18300_009584 [Diaporthe australafricana]|uniref:F-box domain-containing protein n=1 Tax=Diaporthe australafricana TaxID=127596 RepID=A0ABR3WDZ6_9PEZI